MSQPYLGEIRLMGCNFAPVGWAFCNGATLAISQNDALFNLIGTTYGGDGINTFNLPDLQGRIPFHQGSGFVLSQQSGSENVTLLTQQIPQHTHVPMCRSGGSDSANPAGAIWAAASDTQYATSDTANGMMNPAAVGFAGSSQPHENRPPFLVVNFIIALEGIYPSQS